MPKAPALIAWLSHLLSPSPVITLGRVIDDYTEAKTNVLSSHTLLDYALTHRRLLAYLKPEKPFSEITSKEIRAFLATIPGSKKNRKNAHTGLCALWTFAISEGITEIHLPRKVEIAKPEKRVIAPFSKPEIEKILSIAQATGRCNLRDKAILLTLLDTGLRASELAGLTGEDFKSGFFRVLGKGSKERRVPVSSRVAAVIQEYVDTRQDGRPAAPLFLSERGEPLNRDSLKQLIERLGQRAGVTHAHPHRFRHTFALNFILNGGDAYSLQAILGHSTMEMVKHYLNLAEREVATIHKRASPVTNWGL